jgi:hypothetical protein
MATTATAAYVAESILTKKVSGTISGRQQAKKVSQKRCPSKPGHLTLTPVLFRQPRQPRQHHV